MRRSRQVSKINDINCPTIVFTDSLPLPEILRRASTLRQAQVDSCHGEPWSPSAPPEAGKPVEPWIPAFAGMTAKTYCLLRDSSYPFDHSNERPFVFSRTFLRRRDGASSLRSCFPLSRTDESMSSNFVPQEHTHLFLSLGTIFLAPHPGHRRTRLLPYHLPLLAKGFPLTSIISIA